MSETPVPSDEDERLRELDELGALNVLVEPAFQAVAELAAYVCRTPIALVNFPERGRQYFKGHVGTSATDMDRRVRFCPYTVETRRLLEVTDALADPRFRDDPAVTGEPYVRFYAGAPLISSRGHALGVVCVFDHRPRRLAPAQHQALDTLAVCATALLELRHHSDQAEKVIVRLRELEKLKHQFLRTVNHELRTPLTSIRSYVQMLQDGGLDEGTEQRFLEVIDRNSERILGLIDELLLMASLIARTAAFHPERTDLSALARAAVEAATVKAWNVSHTLVLDAPAEVTVWADTKRIRQVLAQLLDNAVKFTPSGGTVEVSVHGDPAPTVEVRDTGIGITPEALEHVFDDFYRAPEAEERAIGGTGLGLPIVARIARMHGGTVDIDSRPGQGTRVRLTFPRPPLISGQAAGKADDVVVS
ncbi:GAF domain-containing sensor histidine kinase [Planomonospora parontospora]|uniref:GAF domain-containing sensor histidine kinase n=1 Tax=Planomonospora parontospora TaxID=58119 RepID=UPI00167148D7|nr:GAF domain-containing sensor histidine kinase [Planomonospora parontospora]GGL40912.1 sensor histidine kinase [Planomonospora parontospora subsp. antibiotica]GII18195.1 sensor histidine kinase [Planomonospora parontospora subsp. antibiotica]